MLALANFEAVAKTVLTHLASVQKRTEEDPKNIKN